MLGQNPPLSARFLQSLELEEFRFRFTRVIAQLFITILSHTKTNLLPYFVTNWFEKFFDKGHGVLSYLWNVFDVMREGCVDVLTLLWRSKPFAAIGSRATELARVAMPRRKA